MKDKIDCYWVWETKNDKDLAKKLEQRVKFRIRSEIIRKLNTLKGEIMSIQVDHKNPNPIVLDRIQVLINKITENEEE